jgi:hypothetical protein
MQQPRHDRQPRAPQPTVVFREDQAESEWSLVDLRLKTQGSSGGGGGTDGGGGVHMRRR